MSEYTRRVVEEELRKKLDELQIELATARKELEVERELRKGAEGDLQAVKHDRDLQEKQIKELQEENADLRKRIKELIHDCIRLTARVEAAKSIAAVWEKAAEGVINSLVEEEGNDDD